jgi:hypothetical protein
VHRQPLATTLEPPPVRTKAAVVTGLVGIVFAFVSVEVSLRLSDHIPFRRSLASKFEHDRGQAGRSLPHFDFVRFDPTLGYRLEPGSYDLEVGDSATKVEITDQGLRESRSYARAARSGSQRIAAIGCSFTFGYGVEEAETWSSRLEDRLADTDVINLGTLGYGQGQSLLRFREDGPWSDAGVLILGLVSMTTVRNSAEVSPFTGVAYPKPHFELHDDELSLVQAPGTETFQADDYDEHGLPMDSWSQAGTYSRTLDALLAPSAERIDRDELCTQRLASRLLSEMNELMQERHGRFLVLYLPVRESLLVHRGQAGVRDPLLQVLREQGLDIVDPSAALAEYLDTHDVDELFAADGLHPGVPYHAIASRAVADTLLP